MRQSMTIVSISTQLPRSRGAGGNYQVHPTDNDPQEILATEVQLPTTTPMPLRKSKRGKADLDHLVKNIKEGKDKQESGGNEKTQPLETKLTPTICGGATYAIEINAGRARQSTACTLMGEHQQTYCTNKLQRLRLDFPAIASLGHNDPGTLYTASG
ncbi:hypothetical protein Tco_0980985 [Tanacetum coccineum]